MDVNNVAEQETDMSVLLAQYDADLTENKIVSFDGDIIQRHELKTGEKFDEKGEKFDEKGEKFDEKGEKFDEKGEKFDEKYDKICEKINELDEKINRILDIVQIIAVKINTICDYP